MSKTAFMFPGQGSQSVGMLSAFGSAAEVRDAFAEASEHLDFDLWALCQDGPVERLNQTEHTQPAMLAADIATWRLWQATGGPRPDFMAGHSLGEYAALVAAGAIGFGDAIALVAERGRLMQAATPEGVGAMAAILGMDDAALEAVCTAAANGQVVSCANYNAPGQVVIAGHAEAVERACAAARKSGARRALPLPVSVPSHCALMRTASEQLAESLAAINIEAPAIPVLHNVDGNTRQDAAAIRDALARQLWLPVRWTASISHLAGQGVERFIECGPGKVLAGLNRRIVPDATTLAITDPASLASAIEEFQP